LSPARPTHESAQGAPGVDGQRGRSRPGERTISGRPAGRGPSCSSAGSLGKLIGLQA